MPKIAEVAETLRGLISASSAKEAKRICRALVVTDASLAALIFNAAAFGYRHQIIRHEHVPEHLELSDEERAAFFGPQNSPDLAARARRKVFRVFDERRVLTAHLFWNQDGWHSFTFTYDDAWAGRRGHWSEGPHLHYTSSVLDPRRTAEAVLTELRDPKGRVHGEHVRFDIERGDAVVGRKGRRRG